MLHLSEAQCWREVLRNVTMSSNLAGGTERKKWSRGIGSSAEESGYANRNDELYELNIRWGLKFSWEESLSGSIEQRTPCVDMFVCTRLQAVVGRQECVKSGDDAVERIEDNRKTLSILCHLPKISKKRTRRHCCALRRSGLSSPPERR